MVEHSPAEAARSSVRAFSAPISLDGEPDAGGDALDLGPELRRQAAMRSSACEPEPAHVRRRRARSGRRGARTRSVTRPIRSRWAGPAPRPAVARRWPSCASMIAGGASDGTRAYSCPGMRAIVGVDVGGTFTDVALIAGGRLDDRQGRRRPRRPVARASSRASRLALRRGGPRRRRRRPARPRHDGRHERAARAARRAHRAAWPRPGSPTSWRSAARPGRTSTGSSVAPPAPLAEVTAEVDERMRARRRPAPAATRRRSSAAARRLRRARRRGRRRVPAALLRPPAATSATVARRAAARRSPASTSSRRSTSRPSSASTSGRRPRSPTPTWARSPAATCAAWPASARRARPARAGRDAVERRRVRRSRRRRRIRCGCSSRARPAASPPWSALGIREAVSFDMGGTSTDVCLIRDGEAGQLLAAARSRGLPVRVPHARHPHRRRGRRLDRLARRGRGAAGRAAERGGRSRAGGLRPRRAPADGDRRERRPRAARPDGADRRRPAPRRAAPRGRRCARSAGRSGRCGPPPRA